MDYVPSLPEDRKLHDRYHKQNTEGYDVGKDFMRTGRERSVYCGVREGDCICAVDRHDKPARRRRAQDVLEIVQRELGAVEIPREEIWGLMRGVGWRYRAYLYVRKTKCVGFLLLQKIEKAYRVEEPVLPLDDAEAEMEKDAKAKPAAATALAALKARKEAAANREHQLAKLPIMLSKTTRPAKLGIARIWTSGPYRQQDIASKMLDVVLEDQDDLHRYDCPEEHMDELITAYSKPPRAAPAPKVRNVYTKEDVAFSQPTEAGTRLARKWFGRSWGWSVYVDC